MPDAPPAGGNGLENIPNESCPGKPVTVMLVVALPHPGDDDQMFCVVLRPDDIHSRDSLLRAQGEDRFELAIRLAADPVDVQLRGEGDHRAGYERRRCSHRLMMMFE